MKRFYKEARAVAVDKGWQIMLDGRGVKTAAGHPQVVPGAALAHALASEWSEQPEEIDPARFALRDMADYAIDIVGTGRTKVIEQVLAYGETDTLCYRAEPGEPLYPRQEAAWDPVLVACESRLGVRLTRVAGIIHQPQPPATLARLRQELETFDDFTLAALQALACLAASLVIGLAALAPDADATALFAIANLEEDWQAERWGQDEQAAQNRARRLRDFAAACRFAMLVGEG